MRKTIKSVDKGNIYIFFYIVSIHGFNFSTTNICSPTLKQYFQQRRTKTKTKKWEFQ